MVAVVYTGIGCRQNQWMGARPVAVTASSAAGRTLHPRLKTSLTRNRSHQVLPTSFLLPSPSAVHFVEQGARTFLLAIDTTAVHNVDALDSPCSWS